MIAPERYSCLGELLTDALVQFKTEVALIEANRKRESGRYTYADFRRAALPLAARLESAGVGPGDRVAILMSNQPRWLIAAYAAMLRGGVLVPLDYKLTAKEQAALLAHARPKALVVEHSLHARFSPSDVDVPLVVVSEAHESAALHGAERWESLPAVQNGAIPKLVLRERDDVAAIVYSSGTGGQPKGCMLTHDAYLEQYRSLSALFPLEIGDRYFSILPTNHAIDFMVGFIGPLAGGATVVHQRALRPEMITWTMKEYGVTHMAVVPLILEAFERSLREKLDDAPPLRRGLFEALATVNELLTERKPRHAVSSTLLKPVHDAFGGELRLLFCGGAFTDKGRAESFYRLGIPVVIGYGLTEACTVATVNDLRPFRADSVGRPVDGVEVRIRDAGTDGVGEVLVRGRTVMTGYLDEPELTAEAIRDGWLHTGDLGWLDASGHLHLVGRSKNMIVTAGGKNVYPEDVEQFLDGLPADELVVLASSYVWPDQPITSERLVAVARAKDEAALRVALAEKNRRLADYKRLGGLLFVRDEMPRTASMKIKRAELAQRIRTTIEPDEVETLVEPSRGGVSATMGAGAPR